LGLLGDFGPVVRVSLSIIVDGVEGAVREARESALLEKGPVGVPRDDAPRRALEVPRGATVTRSKARTGSAGVAVLIREETLLLPCRDVDVFLVVLNCRSPYTVPV
jgi:hypothetical protein